jgi:hypothetical protein
MEGEKKSGQSCVPERVSWTVSFLGKSHNSRNAGEERSMSKPPNRNKYDLQGCLTEIFGELPENKKKCVGEISSPRSNQFHVPFLSLHSSSSPHHHIMASLAARFASASLTRTTRSVIGR